MRCKKAPEGFEPSTLRLLGVRSNQLSYGAAFGGETVMDGQTAIAAGLEPATVGSEVQRSSIEPRDRPRELPVLGRRQQLLRHSIVVRTPGPHPGDPGSIPGGGNFYPAKLHSRPDSNQGCQIQSLEC